MCSPERIGGLVGRFAVLVAQLALQWSAAAADKTADSNCEDGREKSRRRAAPARWLNGFAPLEMRTQRT